MTGNDKSLSILAKAVHDAMNDWRRTRLIDDVDFPIHAAKFIIASDAFPAEDELEDYKPSPSRVLPAMTLAEAAAEGARKATALNSNVSRRLADLLFGKGKVPVYPHAQAKAVVEQVLPRVIRRYLSKSKDYGENAQTLGVKGQFADIHRKYTKLRRAWWEGHRLESESAEEVAEDMIAHLLLALHFLNWDDVEDDLDA